MRNWGGELLARSLLLPEGIRPQNTPEGKVIMENWHLDPVAK